MRVGLLTKEWPPQVYGGAGVHVENLVPALRRAGAEVDVHCFGEPRPDATAHTSDPRLVDAGTALQTLSVDLAIAAAVGGCDVVHSHTWYADLAGHLAALQHGSAHVLTTHSLEPHRPWKAEQLGGGYRVSSWVEKACVLAAHAVIAVSEGTRRDILDVYPDVDPSRVHVVHNGIDPVAYAPTDAVDVLERHGVDPAEPYAIFVGRITRQKGLAHLLRAAADLPGQLVLCAGAPDTPEIAAEARQLVDALETSRGRVVWIREMLPKGDVAQLLAHATVFVCPSVYEPLGIVNLEAMACGTAVVASAVGGIPEVVDDGRTGLLVPYAADEPDAFEHGLADAIASLLADPSRAAAMGAAGRERAVADFGWDAIGGQTVRVYETALELRSP